MCAFQFFLWDRKDHRAAWDAYIRLCMDSGLVPFTRLVPAAGLLNPFEEGAIAKITPGLREYLGSLDMSKIR
ncbi:MAG TPA: hypothetical protein VLA21_01945 [Candidatus Limnocylindria bacterium]|nr:hypothetical protein [Candidatus Limnocylindria bacterium]